MSVLHNSWNDLVGEEFNKPYYLKLREVLKDEYSNQTVYPPMHDLFNALHFTDYPDVKVVIIGQDPYHGPGQAHGLSFSVQPDVKVPPSLKNIYKELQTDLGITPPTHGYLEPWAKQGVLMLNTALSVRKGEPGSHRGLGWEHFTNKVIDCLNEREEPVCFLLWGRHAGEKGERVTNSRHLILTAPHPSPFSAYKGFFGSRPFSTINTWLTEQGMEPIQWELT
ncbi:uracil-DNA glycosylase [Alkalicoccobacillus porphyridii]|uniref:Uracil-DNA glycosylase n=1 Tax=Alkalicoccobacillus porphyridii TaxID=2597270 RepID=A0A553ZU38_9BACI|nr:uracil-DNA glycosylase [Alkalicoccobacillus porphyridii]TSB44999.1 uracil-DNA glycosylase [Alkalicoccobacillus porphyridii]